MTDFLRDLSSVSWWLGVVVVGILINLLSAYAKPRLDTELAKVSERKRARLDADRRNRLALIAELRSDNHAQVMALGAELRDRLRALNHLLLGVFAFLIYLAVQTLPLPSASPGLRGVVLGMGASVMTFGMYCVLSGFRSFRSARRTLNLLAEANEAE